MLGWLESRGVPARRLDITTPAGLAEAAWYELADLEMVPVLAFVIRGAVRRIFKGQVPPVAELREAINELRGDHAK